MRYALLCLLLVGCGDSGELAALKASLRTSEETIVAASSATVEKQDATIAVLRENTAALGLLKTSVEKLKEASLAKSEPQTGKDGDPASALEPPAKANDTQLPLKVATPGASSETLTELATRLYSRGVSVHMKTEEELRVIDAQMQCVKSQPVQYITRGSSCPGGVCPVPQRVSRRGKR